MKSNRSDDRRSGDRPQPVPEGLAGAVARFGDTLGVIGRRVVFFQTVGSTNDVASAIAQSDGDHEGTVVIADAQTAGRGRRGRSWVSPPGSGLYVSVILAPARARADVDRATGLLTIAAGVGLAEGVEAATTLPVTLKWPNDLYLARRKLAGILAEGVMPAAAVRAVVLGYGINVGTIPDSTGLGDRATSIESALGREVDRAQVFGETLAGLARRYADLLDGRFDAILDAWRERAPTSRGARVTWATPSGVRSGVTDGIDPHGALLVRAGEGVERIVAGEVTWL